MNSIRDCGEYGHNQGTCGNARCIRTNSENILLWADGTWCYRNELSDMSHMSDDYETVYADTPRWADFISREGM